MNKMIFLTNLLIVGCWFASTAQVTSTNPSFQNGQSVYETYCMSCHMQDGKGVEGVFPPLIKTTSLGNKNLLVKSILLGQRGPIKVNGVDYNGEMAPISLSDKEVADVLNYIRNSWGNKAPLMKASEVVLAKKSTVKGYQPY